MAGSMLSNVGNCSLSHGAGGLAGSSRRGFAADADFEPPFGFRALGVFAAPGAAPPFTDPAPSEVAVFAGDSGLSIVSLILNVGGGGIAKVGGGSTPIGGGGMKDVGAGAGTATPFLSPVTLFDGSMASGGAETTADASGSSARERGCWKGMMRRTRYSRTIFFTP